MPEIETERLQKLLAKDEIHRAVCNYIRGQDRLDRSLQLSAFHEDAYVDCGVFAGSPKDYVDFAQSALARYEKSHHLLGQIVIEVAGNRAEGEVYFIAWHRLGREAEAFDVFIAGRYVDEYEDRGSGWKIAARREIMDWGHKSPAADDFFVSNLKFHVGRRDGNDFSEIRDWPVSGGSKANP